ncbi:MAG: alpha-amylase family glycosyl hydrolase [Herbiconiux sp.]|nr:alpha-amylase family glycosyl hydrolase [Herbiconiux sp.]
MSTSEQSWVEHVMWWQVYPLGFVGAPIRPEAATGAAPVEHRLGRIAAWLDHLVGLGLNGLSLGPVFAATSHGYDTVDHFRIDPRLGDEGDFEALVAAAHERGVRVLLDGVFNHVGRAHPAFVAVQERGAEAPEAALFRIDWASEAGSGAPDAAGSTPWRPGDPVPAEVFEGHDQLVALDHSSPAVEDLVVSVMTHWLDRGADGWRLDAAYAVPPAFWARVLPRVRQTHPEAWFSGEVIHGDAAALVRESGLDSLTQYELWQGIWHGIADSNLFELAHAVERHSELLGAFIPSTFIGNHDVTRIATALGDARLLPHAVALLFTLAGTPSVYAGDEFGYRAVKEERLGGDDAVRPEFPAEPPVEATLAPDARAALAVHGELIALRRRYPWLHSARTDVVSVTNTALLLRTATGAGAVLTALNIGTEPVLLPRAGAEQVEAGSATIEADGIAVEPFGWAVLTSGPTA